VRYEQRTAESVSKLSPADIILVAAERIAAVGAALGGPPVIELQSLLAAAGNSLPWIKKP
jgi:predicted aconitase with swiveling domain